MKSSLHHPTNESDTATHTVGTEAPALHSDTRRIVVHTEPTYTVHIEHGLLATVGHHMRALSVTGHPVIITDTHVGPLYADTLVSSLQAADYEPLVYTLPAGEESKSPEQLLHILNFLADHCITRRDVLIALGGGVVGDITGFAAATYMRGIAYVQIPTSLLAMVDSSVGGKTAVNLPAGKNLWGAFKQPRAVFCDPDVLHTLPKEEFIGGCGEVVKYTFLDNPALLGLLTKEPLTPQSSHLTDVIAQCVAAKARIVAADETEQGQRQLLNLGHTLAHGLEKYSHYTMPHGYAVAIGIALMAHLGFTHYGLPAEEYQRLIELLRAHHLPVTTEVPLDYVLEAARHDKKSHGLDVTIIVPTSHGHSERITVPHATLAEQLTASLADV